MSNQGIFTGESVPPSSRPTVISKNITHIPFRLTRAGNIKIGEKGEPRKSKYGKDYQAPVKLDHFKITTMHRDSSGNFTVNQELHDKLSTNGGKLRTIPVRLFFDDIDLNFQSRLARYDGTMLSCYGDGTNAKEFNGTTYIDRPCQCGKQDPAYSGKDKCKLNGTLSVAIDNAGIFGVCWQFRTTGFNSTVGLLSSISMLTNAAAGRIAGIPLQLTLTPKAATIPGGKATTIQVVSLSFKGTSEEFMKYRDKRANLIGGSAKSISEMESQQLAIANNEQNSGWGSEDLEEFYPEPANVETMPSMAGMLKKGTINNE